MPIILKTDLRMKISLLKIVRISEALDQNGDRVSKPDKSSLICSMRLRSVLAKYENIEVC